MCPAHRAMTESKANIALIGFMGAGKTTTGRILAHTLNMGFFDFDLEIEKATGIGLPEIFATRGESGFRQLEHEICKNIPFMQNYVIATGGGIVLNPENMALLRQSCTIIYLPASPETIHARLAENNSRPLLAEGDKLAKIRDLLSQREHLYRQYADFILHLDDSHNACQHTRW